MIQGQFTTPESQTADAPSREYYSGSRQEMVRFLPETYTRALEIGCGEGVFATLLTQSCEIWGVEPDSASATHAAKRMHKVLVGYIEDVIADVPSAYFDLVICNDVIEHLKEPEEFLASVKNKMLPGGYVLASIPNIRHWEVLWELLVQKDWRYRRSGILDRSHLRFFTERSIYRLFATSGFSIEQIAGINGVFTPFRRAVMETCSAMTLGYYRDVQFRQFAIRARLS